MGHSVLTHSALSATVPRYSGLYRVPARVGSRQACEAVGRVQQVRIRAEGGRQPWDFGRFVRTLFFFNAPPSLGKLVQAMVGDEQREAPRSSGGEGELVLVTGATGGVGKRVVDELRRRGVRVRALVRDVEKARQLLDPDVEVVAADVTQSATLLPEYFQGVTKLVVAHSCIVGPKEGDTADRQKYYQGIKFFDPEVKGDTPEAVEYRGTQNLLQKLQQHGAIPVDGRVLFSIDSASGAPTGPAWGALDDVVMGGVSASSFQISPTGGERGNPVGLFKGYVSTDNNGGFASIRSRNFDPMEDLTPYDGFEFRIKGDGHRFKFIVRTSTDWDAMGYTCGFDTEKGVWQTIRLPFSSFVPVFRARTVKDAPRFDTSRIASLQLLFSKFEYDEKLNPKFEPGPFELPIASIKAYLASPRIVHVSSAGVTRPERPGLDLSKQPPAVRMNKELGYLLTFKLKGEDVVRESGIPYTIIRPCALTEEPAGAELEFQQGDNITGKISRQEVARIIVDALESPDARDKTFEVKSTVPFSQPFTVDPANPPPERSYQQFFKELRAGITGKEALEKKGAASV